MTNKELQEYLKQFPDELEILMSLNGSIYVEPLRPMKRFIGTSKKDYILINPTIKKILNMGSGLNDKQKEKKGK